MGTTNSSQLMQKRRGRPPGTGAKAAAAAAQSKRPRKVATTQSSTSQRKRPSQKLCTPVEDQNCKDSVPQRNQAEELKYEHAIGPMRFEIVDLLNWVTFINPPFFFRILSPISSSNKVKKEISNFNF